MKRKRFSLPYEVKKEENLPEMEVCKRLGIKVIFGIGGYEKQYSSSKF